MFNINTDMIHPLNSIFKNKIAKNGLILIIIAIFIFTVIISLDSQINYSNERNAQEKTFVWINENSKKGDIILSSSREPSYEYYSQRKVLSLMSPANELEALITNQSNTFVVINTAWSETTSKTEQWLNEKYNPTPIKTFEVSSRNSFDRGIVAKCKEYFGFASRSQMWKIYLISH